MFGFFKNKIIKSEGRGQGDQWPVVLNDFEPRSIMNIMVQISKSGIRTKGGVFSLYKEKEITTIVAINGKIISCYFDPEEYVKNGTASSIEVYEWPNKAEADIKVRIKDTGIVFFATDYAVNKSAYAYEKTLNIEFAGLCSAFSEFNISEINKENELQFDESFTCVTPTESFSFYSIVFDIIDVKKSTLTDGKEFWVVDAKITTSDSPLIVKLYIPISAGKIEKGKKYSAPMLMLGRISKNEK
jgi:hypothetical protein